MKQRGGARPGAGRKPGSVIQHDIVNLCRTSVPEIIMRLIDISLGRVDGVDYGTQVKAANLVIERGYGKAIQPTDVTSNGQTISPTINITTGSTQPSPAPEAGNSIQEYRH